MIRMTLSIVVGAMVIRHLGPADFGYYSYVQSIVIILTPISSLGINNLIVKRMSDSGRNLYLMAGAWFVKLLASSAVFLILATYFLDQEDINDYYTTCALVISLTPLLQSLVVVELYNQAKSNFYIISLVNIVLAIISAVLKCVIIYFEGDLIYFCYMFLFDIGSGYLILFLLSFVRTAKYLSQIDVNLRDLWNSTVSNFISPAVGMLILSGVSTSLWMRLDVIMIEHYLGYESVGYYSSAIRISEALNMLPTIILTVLFPVLLSRRSVNNQDYQRTISLLYKLLFFISLFIAAIFSVTSDIIISSLYGSGYHSSSTVLSITSFTFVFVAISLLNGRYFTIEELFKSILIRNVVALIINALLNWVFIPKYGLQGAAWASVFAWFTSAILVDVFDLKNRKYLRIKYSV